MWGNHREFAAPARSAVTARMELRQMAEQAP
jgi:hypothetical protein